MTHQPLRVIARMAEPIVYYGDGLHLDGPLAFGAFRRLPVAEREALPPVTMTDWPLDLDLPLARWSVETPLTGHEDARLLDGNGLVWGWCASAVHAHWLCEDRHDIRKMPQTDEMVRRGADVSVNLAGGQLKACSIAMPARFARDIHWYALGDLDGVRACLDHVRAIGKLANQGPGRVLEWLVEPWPHDWSTRRDGQLTRAMPYGYHPGGGGLMATIRPPYWSRTREVMAALPDYESLNPEAS